MSNTTKKIEKKEHSRGYIDAFRAAFSQLRLFNTLRSSSAKGFTLVELVIIIVIIGILAAVVTVGLSGVMTSSANNVRSTEVKQWASTFDLYKNRYGSWPVLPTNDSSPVTLCLRADNKCGNLSSPVSAYSSNSSVLTALTTVGKQPQNTAPVSDNVAGPLAYVSQKTDPSTGVATVTVKYIGLFQNTCPNGFSPSASDSALSADSTLGAMITRPPSGSVACTLNGNNTFAYDTGSPPVTPTPTPTPTPPAGGGAVAPAVTTDSVANVSTTSATLNGNLTATGSLIPVRVFFACGTTAGQNINYYGSNAVVSANQYETTTGVFSATVSGFQPGTKYYCSAVAEGSYILPGNEISFTTSTPPTPPTPTPKLTSYTTPGCGTYNIDKTYKHIDIVAIGGGGAGGTGVLLFGGAGGAASNFQSARFTRGVDVEKNYTRIDKDITQIDICVGGGGVSSKGGWPDTTGMVNAGWSTTGFDGYDGQLGVGGWNVMSQPGGNANNAVNIWGEPGQTPSPASLSLAGQFGGTTQTYDAGKGTSTVPTGPGAGGGGTSSHAPWNSSVRGYSGANGTVWTYEY